MRRRMGAAALEADAAPDGSAQRRWRATVAARLPSPRWPQRPVLITAVDAHTGAPVVFDRHSGVGLVDAVAASTANGFGVPPYRIGGHRYIDGGYRRNENADLAAGYRRVLVLSPFGGRSRHPLEWGMQLAAQVGELRRRQQRRNDLPGWPFTQRVRGQHDGSVDAPARRPSRIRPGPGPGRAAHRILALTPTKPADPGRPVVPKLSWPRTWEMLASLRGRHATASHRIASSAAGDALAGSVSAPGWAGWYRICMTPES